MEKRKVSYEELLGLVKKPILHPPPEPVHDGTPMTSDERGAELPESIMSSTLNDAPLDAQNKLSLDFNKIANSSDFQRFIIYLAKKIAPLSFKGVSTRVSEKVMTQQFNRKRAEYIECMKELKEVLKKRNERK